MQTFSFCVVFVFGKQAMRVFFESVCTNRTVRSNDNESNIAMKNNRVATNEIYLSHSFFSLPLSFSLCYPQLKQIKMENWKHANQFTK